MKLSYRSCAWSLVLCVALLSPAALAAQPGTAVFRGQILDQTGALVPGATVSLTGEGYSKEITASDFGQYAFRGVPPGKYTVGVTAKGFALYLNDQIVLVAGQEKVLDVPILVTLEKQEVKVSETNTTKLDVDASSNVGALVLRGADLDMLSDNPDDLQDDLQALAGPAAGPNGGQIYIDGFTGGRLPPKESIREIRVNQSPFSAEYDRLGFGRIEILTKPGTNKFRGQSNFNFGDAIFNSRNPYLTTAKPPYQQKEFGGNVSGPINKKSSFFVDVERRMQDEVAVVNATVLDSSFNSTPFSQAVVTPNRRTTVNPRFDYQLGANHTLVARYTYSMSGQQNLGVNTFSLPSRAFNTDNHEQTLQVTETSVLNARAINETRFQFVRRRNNELGDNSTPAIQVPEAFTGGGSSIGRAYNNENRYELQNYTSLTRGVHLLRFGARMRASSQSDFSTSNFNGTFLFTSLDAYRITVLGQKQGLTDGQIRAAGGGPSQFSINGGTNLSGVSQVDLGLYLQEEWRVRSNFSLSLGIRYETQNNISDHADIAPRVGFAWGLGTRGSRQPKTVIRGGLGLFYDRFSENLTLDTIRLNGVTQQQFVVPSPSFFPNVSSLATLTANKQPQAIRETDSRLRAPYMGQAAIGIERQLPKNITMAMTYTRSRGVHTLRSRNINAPLPNGDRPYPAGVSNLYLYESSGIFNQNQLITNINARINSKFNLTGFYSLNQARSTSDGAGSFPANQYDESTEYSRAGFDVRHRLFLGGGITAPWGVRLSPFVTINSGGPFNITVGKDLNGDSLYNDRPALATDASKAGVVKTTYGLFDTNPAPGVAVIPRNYGNGPGQFSVNLRLAKTFGFGERAGAAQRAAAQDGGGGGDRGGMGRGGPEGMGGGGPRGEGGGPRGGGGGGGGPRGGGGDGGGGGGPRGGGGGGGGGGPMGGIFDGGSASNRYNITFSISARNLFNHVNPGSPIGNLISPQFGQSKALGGGGFGGGQTANRRIEFQMRFGF